MQELAAHEEMLANLPKHVGKSEMYDSESVNEGTTNGTITNETITNDTITNDDITSDANTNANANDVIISGNGNTNPITNDNSHNETKEIKNDDEDDGLLDLEKLSEECGEFIYERINHNINRIAEGGWIASRVKRGNRLRSKSSDISGWV